MTLAPGFDHARVAYDGFAAVYDAFTAHHRYDEWTATLEGLARRHGLAGSSLLDIACGTGKSFLPFIRRGYQVTACDISEEMVLRARAKCSPQVEVSVRDMRALPPLGAFDFVCCLDDAMNYLLTPTELVATMRGVANNLSPDGVALFDVNTLRSYRRFFGTVNVVQSDGTVVVLEGDASATFGEGDAVRAVAEAFTRADDGGWSRHAVVHHQRHLARSEVESAASTADMSVMGIYGMHEDGTADEGFDELTHSKAVYVMRLASSV